MPAKKKPSKRSVLSKQDPMLGASRAADAFLKSLSDPKFAKAFAKNPSEAMRQSDLDFDVATLMAVISVDKARYRAFLEKLADTVEPKLLRDVLAASTCDGVTAGSTL